MEIWESILLGAIQGLTEFLPVSSSGHLVLAQKLLGLAPGDLSFEVAVHAGTIVAVILYFGRRLLELAQSVMGLSSRSYERGADIRLLVFIIIGSIPAAVLGLLFKDHIEELFAAPLYAALALILTGIWLLLMKVVHTSTRSMNVPRAFVIGIAQAAAMMPGLSRSGSTIATGAMMGIRPAEAAEFSFLLSIPAVLGANVVALPEAMTFGRFGTPHVVGAVVAAIVGYLSLRWVFASIRHGNFQWFGVYCLVVGGVSTLLLI